nr:hypothetical protein [Escherichia coli]
MTTIRPSPGGDRDEHRHRRALFDVTHSRLKSDAHDDSGQSYRATFNRMFTDTQTSIVLAAYRYSTKGYYNLNDALYAVDQEKNSRSNYTLWRQKNGMTFTVNQNLPDGWGGFLSQRPYLRLLEPLRDREAVSGQLQQFIWSSLPVGERAARLYARQLRSSSRRSYFTQLQLPAVVWR